MKYLIVGSGYRSEYFARIAMKHRDLFRAMFLCRSEEKAAAVSARTGVPATTRPEEGLAFRPDFIVVAVDRAHTAAVAIEWIGRGYPVVTETPVGATREELDALWALSCGQGAKIVCCEQYHRYPILANGLSEVQAGRIGRPVSAYLSLAHDYHGFSLIRRMLGVQGEDFTLRGARVSSQVAATDSRYGAILDGSLAKEERDIVHIAFSSGKTAVYDFSSIQYRTFIRARHLTVRGEKANGATASSPTRTRTTRQNASASCRRSPRRTAAWTPRRCGTGARPGRASCSSTRSRTSSPSPRSCSTWRRT